MKPDKRNSKASAICDRTGVRYPMNQMVIEPGTNYLVHRSVSDGNWSLVEHPLSNMAMYLRGKSGDPFPIPQARLDTDWDEPQSYAATVTGGGVGVMTANANVLKAATATMSGTGTMVAEGAEVGAHDWLLADWNSSDWDV